MDGHSPNPYYQSREPYKKLSLWIIENNKETINDSYNGEMKITVIATGFDEKSNQASKGGMMKSVSGNTDKPTPQETLESELETPAFLRKKLR